MSVPGSGRLSPSHDLTQSGATGLSAGRIECLPYLGGMDRFCNSQSEYSNDRRISYRAYEMRPERSQYPRQALAIMRYGQVSVTTIDPRMRSLASWIARSVSIGKVPEQSLDCVPLFSSAS